MPKNRITDLRDHLFETLEALKDKDNPMDLERAKVIAQVSQTIINSATVEVKLMNALCRENPATTFFGVDAAKEEPEPKKLARLAGK